MREKLKGISKLTDDDRRALASAVAMGVAHGIENLVFAFYPKNVGARAAAVTVPYALMPFLERLLKPQDEEGGGQTLPPAAITSANSYLNWSVVQPYVSQKLGPAIAPYIGPLVSGLLQFLKTKVEQHVVGFQSGNAGDKDTAAPLGRPLSDAETAAISETANAVRLPFDVMRHAAKTSSEAGVAKLPVITGVPYAGGVPAVLNLLVTSTLKELAMNGDEGPQGPRLGQSLEDPFAGLSPQDELR